MVASCAWHRVRALTRDELLVWTSSRRVDLMPFGTKAAIVRGEAALAPLSSDLATTVLVAQVVEAGE